MFHLAESYAQGQLLMTAHSANYFVFRNKQRDKLFDFFARTVAVSLCYWLPTVPYIREPSYSTFLVEIIFNDTES